MSDPRPSIKCPQCGFVTVDMQACPRCGVAYGNNPYHLRECRATRSAPDAWAHARATTAICPVCNARVPADLLLRHEATHSELEHEIVRLQREAFIKCPDCGGVGGLETNGSEWVGPMRLESCETCDGTGRLRDPNDDGLAP